MNEPTHLDLFSGIGGFVLAAQWAGFRTIGFSEIDPYASAVLKKHWPNVPNYGDVRTIPAIRCDLITGGFPCQPFSCAGKRRGKADDRYLWPAMLDVITRCRPAWVLGENVTGIVQMELDSVCADLEAAGYQAQPLIIPACAVDAKHRRDRVWIVGYAESGRQPMRRSTSGDCGHTSQSSQALANAESTECERSRIAWQGRTRLTNNSQTMADTNNSKTARQRKNSREIYAIAESKRFSLSGCSLWPTEPPVGRVADGIPHRVDRLKCLGNAIVPQVAFEILKVIYESLTAGSETCQ